MTVSAGNLDALLNVSFTATNVTGLAIQGFTLNGTSIADYSIATLTASSTGTPLFGATSFKVTGVSDLFGTITLQSYVDGGSGPVPVGSNTYHALGFTANFILLTGNTSNVVAVNLQGGNDISATMAMLSPSSIPLGQTPVFSATGVFTAALPCYVSGTRILTARGQLPVEALRIGDLVATLSGRLAPVRWIGFRTIAIAGHPVPEDVAPVRVSAGAFGPARPLRDLCLSPDHAVFVPEIDALIPVRHLVNGATIRRADAVSVTYYHVELDRHDIMLAEGLPAESYLDTGNRSAFANGGPAIQLHPDFGARAWDVASCARLVSGGAELARQRERLRAEALRLGHCLTSDPALEILADGRLLRPETVGTRLRYHLPRRTRDLALRSRSARPIETHASHPDARRLGVAFSRVLLDGAPAPSSELPRAAGWYPPERHQDGTSWQWTDGNARLPAAGARLLELEILMTETYWLEGAAIAATPPQAVPA